MSTTIPHDLRTVIAEAIHAYELAQATRIQLENASQQQYAQQVRVGEAQQQTAKQQLNAEYQRNQTQGKAEQERIGHLLAAIGDVDKTARDLLQQAGLAHITGAPVRVTGDVAPVRRTDGEVATAFAAAQLAQADLKGTLLRLAQVYLDAGHWEEVRRVLQPLLSDPKSPWHHEAQNLFCESYYRPGQQALAAGQWENARTQLEAVLAQQATYRDAATLRRTAYLRPAQHALEAKQWDVVRQHIQPWLGKEKSDAEARTLLCESYYRPGQQALTAGQWENARTQLEAVLAQQANYRDAASLLRTAYLRPAQQALEASQWDAVRQHIQPWLRKEKSDAEARTLLCESYYRQAKQASDAKQDQTANVALQALLKFDAFYRDAAVLARRVAWSLLNLEFIKIPAGKFIYGENKQQIHLDDFWISKTPITNAQYKIFVDATGYEKPQHWGNGKITIGKEQHPVIHVSWEDAQAFCRWAGVQLPGERQWEKAARGTDGRTYPWGEAAPDGNRCNFNESIGDTSTVGQYPQGASPYGVLDMAGNVFEWCEDVHEAGADRRVLRGGYYNANDVWCAARGNNDLNSRHDYSGFRVVAPSF